jgi:hypothetical protein
MVGPKPYGGKKTKEALSGNAGDGESPLWVNLLRIGGPIALDHPRGRSCAPGGRLPPSGNPARGPLREEIGSPRASNNGQRAIAGGLVTDTAPG